jgi:hypothetical protein
MAPGRDACSATQSEIIGEAHLALAGKPLHFHA